MGTIGISKLLLCILLLAACGQQVRNGVVIEKQDTPAHSERYQSGSTCLDYDKHGNCDWSIPIYSERWVSEAWSLRLQDCTASPNKDGKVECNVGWLGVSASDFERAIIGQFYESAGK